MLATFGHSDNLDVSRWSGVSQTCPQQVVRVGLVKFSERHDKRTKELHYRSRPPAANVTRKSLTQLLHNMLRGCYEEVTELSDVSLACYEEVNDKLRTCYDELTRKLLPWKLALTPLRRINITHVSWCLTSLFSTNIYGYIRDERSGVESYPYSVWEGQRYINLNNRKQAGGVLKSAHVA